MRRTGEVPAEVAGTPTPCAQDHVTIDARERFGQGMRWKLGFNTSPCIQSRKGAKCVFCGFMNYHSPIPPAAVGQTFKDILNGNNLHSVGRLELYVSGSFFDDEEVSPESRLEIVEAVAKTGIDEVVLESRPEFIVRENLAALAKTIDPGRITIAVGVETTDDEMRCNLAKDFSLDDLAASIHTIARAGMSFQAYLLLGPPGIESETKAISDVMRSAATVLSLTESVGCPLTLAIQPFFLARNSVVAQGADQDGQVRPPWLYTTALTLRLLDAMRDGHSSRFSIILGNEVDNVETILVPSNYSSDGSVCSCTDGARKHLCEANISVGQLKESADRVLGSRCSCKDLWQADVGAKLGELLRHESLA